MLNHELRRDEGILVLNPSAPLEATDFTTVASQVDAYLEAHGMLHGVLVRAKWFPGWRDLGALLAHLKFVKAHHQRFEKVAVVADGAFARIMPNIGNHFVLAQVQHFDSAREGAAWAWLRGAGSARERAAT